MNLNDLNNACIQIHKNSITVLNPDTLKTAGIVKDCIPFKNLQTNKQINYSKILRLTGIWGHPKQIIKYTFIVDGILYQLRNLNGFEWLTPEEQEKENSFYNNLELNNIHVVNVKKIFA